MSTRPAPQWLAELQARFGSIIRTPLDRSTGTLRAAVTEYDPVAVSDASDGPRSVATERLAVYNRQYWFRLFTVLQRSFPITVRLLGAWEFNGYASRFLITHPPRGWDLDHAPDGFERFLVEALEGHAQVDALVDAATLDDAWRRLFRAPETRPFHPSAEDAARLLDARLVMSPAMAVVRERYPLLEARASLLAMRFAAPIAPPERLDVARWWGLAREPAGVRHLPLEAREGELLSLLSETTVRDALATLEARCSDQERAALPTNAQRWLARSVERGVWSAMTTDV